MNFFLALTMEIIAPEKNLEKSIRDTYICILRGKQEKKNAGEFCKNSLQMVNLLSNTFFQIFVALRYLFSSGGENHRNLL